MTETADHSLKTIIGRAVRKAVLFGCAAFALVSLLHHGAQTVDPQQHEQASTGVQLPSYWWCPQGFSDVQCGA